MTGALSEIGTIGNGVRDGVVRRELGATKLTRSWKVNKKKEVAAESLAQVLRAASLFWSQFL
jgi:hypothetical protein